MLSVLLGNKKRPLRNLLCLGAHCDDIEIGCGGTILRLIQENPGLQVHWVVFSSNPLRKKEALKAARLFLKGVSHPHVLVKTFKDGHFPTCWASIKTLFETLKGQLSPDLILTHYRQDLHQDHRVICDLTWNTFRNHLILEYEIPKYDGDLGIPNFFLGLDNEICRKKIDFILQSFQSQSQKQWFTEETFRALLRIRGIESNSPHKYAEAFYGRKIYV